MTVFSTADLIAAAFFAVSWAAYYLFVEWSARGRASLNRIMDDYRHVWMRRMLAREQRIVDAQIVASLQNGSAFFASTSLFAIGAALALLKSTDQALDMVRALPFGIETTRAAWEAKVVGLAVIFVYAFFKFAWAYRLFNYMAILVGAAAMPDRGPDPEGEAIAAKAARLAVVAGRHFNRGQRAFFFALAYLGWFIGPVPFMIATAAVLVVIWRRQFASDSVRALDGKA
jgi:uncharacterized membrane protein